MTTDVQPNTSFDWAIYADATFAGLSVLIPVPIVDWAFEEFFRRRMPAAIAARQGRRLSPAQQRQINWRESSCFMRVLTFPFRAAFGLILRIFRKIVYVLTVKKAADQLSYYWNRAFLLDYMLRAGHLETDAAAARQALDQTLRATASPLRRLADEIIGGVQDAWQTLRRARQGQSDGAIRQIQEYMERRWSSFASYFEELAARYMQTYQQMQGRSARPV